MTRWEQEQGLPVHRHSTGTVYAYKTELDAWWTSRDTTVGNDLPKDAPSQWPRFRGRWMWVSVATCLFVFIGTIWLLFTRQTAHAPPKLIPLTTYPGIEGPPALSPDGNHVAFARSGDLFVKPVDGEALAQLTSTPVVETSPSWSPDGRQIAFRREHSIFVTSPLGGGERRISDTRPPPLLTAIAWTPDGSSLVLSEMTSPICASLFVVYVATGEHRRLTSPPETSIGDGWPSVSPDGRTIAFARYSQDTSAAIYSMPLTGGVPRQISGTQGLMFGLTWSRDGREVVFSSNRDGSIRLWRLRANSSPAVAPLPVAGAGQDARFPSIAHAASGALSRLAYQHFEDNMDIRRSEIVTDPRGRQTLNPSTPLIASTRSEDHPHYSPDGSKIAFVSNRSGTWELWVSDSDGSKALRITFMDGPIVLAPRWSPDGRRIAFFATTGISGKYQSWIVNAAGGPPQRLMPDDSHLQALPNWSSDGRWIYFGSGRSGSLQVWKVPVDGGPPRQVTTGGGVDSAESPDGKSVYYAKVPEVGPGLWSVPVDGGQELQVLSEARFGYWALAKSGIYYIDFSVGHDTTKPVNFFRFDTRETTHIGNVEASVSWRNNSGFAVSPDGRWLLYSNLQSGSADLMLLDNFR